MKHPTENILCFVKYYLPGYKSGGPVRTISNFVRTFHEDFNITVVCYDRDSGSSAPYKGIKQNHFSNHTYSKVFYLKKSFFDFFIISKICLSNFPIDYIYLNSFFSFKFSLLPLLIFSFRRIHSRRIILAPRGELSSSSLCLKSLKKNFYISIFSFCICRIKLYGKPQARTKRLILTIFSLQQKFS